MAIACIDTHVLIWGIQQHAGSGQEDMLLRATALLAQFEKDKTRVIVPSIVFAEFLLGLPQNEHARFGDIVTRRFIIVPFDFRASTIFAKIWHQKTNASIIAEIRATGVAKTHLRADTMIIASAIGAGASVVYGHDSAMARLSEGFVGFKDLGTMSLQSVMFGLKDA